METSAPIDATKTTAWADLVKTFGEMKKTGINLRQWFNDDPSRVEKLSFTVNDLYFDLSKNLITPEMIKIFAHLAEEVHLHERTEQLFTGEHINVTEDRAVLHIALRMPDGQQLTVDGQDVITDVHTVLNRMYEFANKIRSGEWRGITGKKITTVVNIGIGGSDLGPVMVYEALKPYSDAGITARFISNIDPNDIAEKTRDLDPETTLFIVVSKSFTTIESMTNALDARTWLLNKLIEQNAINNTEDQCAQAVRHHFVAVSTALDKVAAFGIDPDNTFGFWNWVGGRYSVDSAVGLSLIITLGPARFKEFLDGFHSMDMYFRTTDYENNVVVLLAMMNVWYTNFFGAESHAVLPYNQYLHRFPAYLQQLTMESNGKSVRWDGTPVTTKTGEIYWGEPGTNGQHSFYQLIHQGTHIIPADFIAFVNTSNPVTCSDQDVQELFLSNFLAQTKALAFGKTAQEVRREGNKGPLVAARTFNGNRPTTSIFGDTLTPYSLGELISLYEMIVFTEGTVWGIDSFDQWGVELGKVLAKQIAPALAHDESAYEQQDQSTQALIQWYYAHRH